MKKLKPQKATNHQIQALRADISNLAGALQGIVHRLGMQIAITNAIIENFQIGPKVAEILNKYREAALQMRVEQSQVDAMVNGVGVVDTAKSEPSA